ncbi:hypothetical protein SETIT_3G020500v2 [Setaria italica]|uniref:Uncharacterized protein n=1 Tax=Setaria italica TaxID=4555 RepID=A0A368QAQ4_SETIT|nr:hypothetical protein SETIT_3G020500v2 [Setaria italica]
MPAGFLVLVCIFVKYLLFCFLNGTEYHLHRYIQIGTHQIFLQAIHFYLSPTSLFLSLINQKEYLTYIPKVILTTEDKTVPFSQPLHAKTAKLGNPLQLDTGC